MNSMEPQPDVAIGRQVARSGVWSAGGQVAVLGASLVATPFTVRLLGPSAYGLLSLINSVIAYVTVLDLGMGAASTRFGSRAYARGDRDAEAGVIWTAAAISAVPTALVAVVLCVFARPVARDVLHVGTHLQTAAEISLRLAAVALVARVVAAVLNTAEQVRLRWDLIVGITTGGSLLQIALIPIVLALGRGVVAAVVVILVTAALTMVGHAVVGMVLLPAMRRPRVDRSAVRPLVGFGSALVAANGLAIVLGNAERFLLAHDNAISDVGAYAVASNIAALLAVLPIALSQPLLPAFARLGAAEDWERVGRLYRKGITYVLVAALPGATILAVIGRPFLRVWAGETYALHSARPLWILLAGIVVNAVTFLPYNLLLSLGATRVIARCHLIELPLFVLYAPVLVSRFGAAGAATVWTIRIVIAAWLVFRAAKRRMGSGPAIASVVGPLLAPALVLAAPLVVLATTGSDLLGALVVVPAVVVYGRVAWRRSLDDEDRAEARALGRRAIRLIPGAAARLDAP